MLIGLIRDLAGDGTDNVSRRKILWQILEEPFWFRWSLDLEDRLSSVWPGVAYRFPATRKNGPLHQHAGEGLLLLLSPRDEVTMGLTARG